MCVYIFFFRFSYRLLQSIECHSPYLSSFKQHFVVVSVGTLAARETTEEKVKGVFLYCHCEWSALFYFIIFIKPQLIYNIVLVSGVNGRHY